MWKILISSEEATKDSKRLKHTDDLTFYVLHIRKSNGVLIK